MASYAARVEVVVGFLVVGVVLAIAAIALIFTRRPGSAGAGGAH